MLIKQFVFHIKSDLRVVCPYPLRESGDIILLFLFITGRSDMNSADTPESLSANGVVPCEISSLPSLDGNEPLGSDCVSVLEKLKSVWTMGENLSPVTADSIVRPRYFCTSSVASELDISSEGKFDWVVCECSFTVEKNSVWFSAKVTCSLCNTFCIWIRSKGKVGEVVRVNDSRADVFKAPSGCAAAVVCLLKPDVMFWGCSLTSEKLTNIWSKSLWLSSPFICVIFCSTDTDGKAEKGKCCLNSVFERATGETVVWIGLETILCEIDVNEVWLMPATEWLLWSWCFRVVGLTVSSLFFKNDSIWSPDCDCGVSVRNFSPGWASTSCWTDGILLTV